MSYVSEVLADTPVAYWRMEETSGTSVADETGNGWTGTVTGANLNVSGPTTALGSAIDFDGVDDGVSVGSTITDPYTERLTAEFWVYRHEVASRIGYIVKYETTDNQRQFSIDSSSDGNRIQFVWSPDGINFGVMETSSTSVLTVNTWHHVVLTWDMSLNSGMARVFVDNVELTVTGSARTSSIPTKTAPFRIGRSYTTDRHLDGLMDEVAFYNTALTPARIQAHYDARNTAEATAPVLSSTGKTATTVDLSWTDTGSAEWQVDRDGTRIAVTSGLTYQDTGLSPSTGYTYRVRGRDIT